MYYSSALHSTKDIGEAATVGTKALFATVHIQVPRVCAGLLLYVCCDMRCICEPGRPACLLNSNIVLLYDILGESYAALFIGRSEKS